MVAPPFPLIAYCCAEGENDRLEAKPENSMRGLRALFCLVALLADLPPAQAAFDLAEAKQLIVKYRHQWLAGPDRIREARIGEIYDAAFVGTAVCVAVDRALGTGGYTGLQPLLIVINKLDVTPPQTLFQPPPKTTFEYKVTAAPADARCAGAPMLPFPELRNIGGHLKH
jgi:hypothetical protein